MNKKIAFLAAVPFLVLSCVVWRKAIQTPDSGWLVLGFVLAFFFATFVGAMAVEND